MEIFRDELILINRKNEDPAMSKSQKAYCCYSIVEKVILLCLIFSYYPRSWMFEYLDVVVNTLEPD